MVKNKSDVWLTFTQRGSLKLAKEWNYRGCLPFLSPQTAACRATALRCLQTTAVLAAVLGFEIGSQKSTKIPWFPTVESSTSGDFSESSKAVLGCFPLHLTTIQGGKFEITIFSLESGFYFKQVVAEPLTSAVLQFQGRCLPGLEALDGQSDAKIRES